MPCPRQASALVSLLVYVDLLQAVDREDAGSSAMLASGAGAATALVAATEGIVYRFVVPQVCAVGLAARGGIAEAACGRLGLDQGQVLGGSRRVQAKRPSAFTTDRAVLGSHPP
jgi:hypothetical protein